MRASFLLTVILLALSLPFTYGGCGGGANSKINEIKKLQSISITPNEIILPFKSSLQLTATGNYSDGTNEDLTNQVIWKSNKTNLVRIDNKGMISCNRLRMDLLNDQTIISASLKDITADQIVVVYAVLTQIEIRPSSNHLPPGWFDQYYAWGHYSNHGQRDFTDKVVWNIEDPLCGTVGNGSDNKGQVLSIQPGTTSITASYKSFISSSDLIVTPVQTLDSNGSMFPPPNIFMSPPYLDINNHGVIFTCWKFQNSGEIFHKKFIPGHGWLPTRQLNKANIENHVYGITADINDSDQELILWRGAYGIYATFSDIDGVFDVPTKVSDVTPSGTCVAGLDEKGNAIVVWVDQYNVYSSSYDSVSKTWSAANFIGNRGDSAGGVEFAFNSNGDAVILWDHWGPEGWKLFVSYYFGPGHNSPGWQPPHQLHLDNVYYSSTVDINDAGQAIAAWAPRTGDKIYAAIFSPLTGWGNKEIIPIENEGGFRELTLKMNQHGDAVLAYTSFTRTIQVNRYQKSGGWLKREQIRGKNAGDPSVFTPYIDGIGQIMIMWKTQDYNAIGDVELRRYLIPDGWQTIEPLFYVGKLGNAYNISNVFNNHGEGVIGWYEVLPIGYGSYIFISNELYF